MAQYNFKDLTGQKFGRLTVINRAENDKCGHARWLCKCECGNTKIILGSHLRRGLIQSCGCLQREKIIENTKTHGMTNTRIFHIWQNIKNRCYNINCDKYEYYGERGIIVCDEWKDNFVNFYTWAMSNGYTDELTIDRIDVNGNYEPNNCKWATQIEQARNKRNNVYITYNGETHTLPEWSEITKINKGTLYTRYYRDNKRGKDLFKNA